MTSGKAGEAAERAHQEVQPGNVSILKRQPEVPLGPPEHVEGVGSNILCDRNETTLVGLEIGGIIHLELLDNDPQVNEQDQEGIDAGLKKHSAALAEEEEEEEEEEHRTLVENGVILANSVPQLSILR